MCCEAWAEYGTSSWEHSFNGPLPALRAVRSLCEAENGCRDRLEQDFSTVLPSTSLQWSDACGHLIAERQDLVRTPSQWFSRVERCRELIKYQGQIRTMIGLSCQIRAGKGRSSSVYFAIIDPVVPYILVTLYNSKLGFIVVMHWTSISMDSRLTLRTLWSEKGGKNEHWLYKEWIDILIKKIESCYKTSLNT